MSNRVDMRITPVRDIDTGNRAWHIDICFDGPEALLKAMPELSFDMIGEGRVPWYKGDVSAPFDGPDLVKNLRLIADAIEAKLTERI